MKKTAVVTIASANYFAQVQILIDSLAKTNPSWDRYFGVVDDVDDELIKACEGRCNIIEMTEIDIPNVNDMKFRYDIMELNTAIKPFVLLYLLKSYDRVVYMDPDICVYKELMAVNKAFDEGYEFVVTPHFTDYWEMDDKHPNEPDILMAGTYNFGFFAAANCDAARKVIGWWADKLETLCINKQAEGIFVDQKWMDLLPGRHDKVFILRDSGYNTAYWNLSHRRATYENGEYYFNGDPLVFFHFSGFDPRNLDSVSKHQNRHSMDDLGPAKKLFYNYANEALRNGYDSWRKKPYSYNEFSDGREIKDIFRRLFREQQSIFEMVGTRNPFDCSEVFYDQKEKMAPMLINYILLTNNTIGVYFLNTKREQWIQWFVDVCRSQYKLDEGWIKYIQAFLRVHLSQFNAENITPDFDALKENVDLKNGVNIIGYIKSEHGVGEACRLTAEALATTSLKWSAYDWELNNPSRQTDNTWDFKIKNTFPYNVSIFNINADQMLVARQYLPEEAWKGYRIGIWYWELEEFPDQWCEAFELVDEIWAPTRFIQKALLNKATCPVIYMPPGIKREEPKAEFNRAYFGLPEKAFLYLNFFDALSYTNRKNPYASIKAFQMAFEPEDMSVGLVLKVNNVSNKPAGIEELKTAISGYKNIHVIAETMAREEINGLLNTCDVAISLHRSEGLGLLCEEAMYYGKPVIATNWSGNTDFMTQENSCLVDYQMIPVGEYYGTANTDLKWADPDVHHASEYMIRLHSNKEYYEYISENAKKYIRGSFSPEVCGKRMEERICEIQKDSAKVTRYMLEREAQIATEQKTEVEAQGSLVEENIYDIINKNWDIQYYHELSSNASFSKMRVLLKRIVRKLCRGVVEPITITQTKWNAAVVKIVNELTEKSRNENKEIYRLQSENLELRKEFELLKHQLRAQKNEITIAVEKIQEEKDELNKRLIAQQKKIARVEEENTSLDQKVARQIEKTKNEMFKTKLFLYESVNRLTEEKRDVLKEIANIQKEVESLNTADDQSTSRIIQHMGSLYNGLYHTMMQWKNAMESKEEATSHNLEKCLIENKWNLIDKFYHEPKVMECTICGTSINTEESERFVSNDIFGGGQLIRYRCPSCGAIVGPNKMLALSEEELAEEYKFHYRCNEEGDATDAEIETFMSLKPEKGKKYLNYGCGAWSATIKKLREQGYDVYGYDPYAPCDSEYIITDMNALKKNKFDGIFSHDLLEHLRWPVETFKLFSELLREDGKMAHSTGCYKYVYEYDRFHLVFYTGNAVGELCRKTGFLVQEEYRDDYRLTYNYIFVRKD